MASETVLLGGFAHETNTFAPDKTDRELFQEQREYIGDAVAENMAKTNTCEGGAIDVAETEGIDLVHTVSATATPGGVVEVGTYEFYTGLLLERVEEHTDELDGVCLCLHGAMIPDGIDSGEGPFVARIRDVVGPDVPIAVTLDLHGNITDELIEETDLLVAYEKYPHTDKDDTGRRAMRFLTQMMRGELDPEMHIERPPVLPMGPKQNTRDGPMAEVMSRAREYEEREDVVKVNVFPGFHQADLPSMGFSIPVVATNSSAAKQVSRELAEYVWERRQEFVGDYPEPEKAVSTAKRLAADLNDADGPVVMADVGDNPGGGGAADGTTVLREMLEQDLTNAGFAIIRDSEAVEACVGAGVGERVTLDLGGKTDDMHGEPIENLNGYVAAITDGEFVNTGPMGTDRENHLGRTVHLRCGHEDSVSVLGTENRLQPLDTEIWRHAGIQPERLDVLVVKSTNHFRADYEPMASEVIPINSIGLAAIDPRKFEFERIRRPQFPLDEMDDDAYPDWK